MNHPDPVSLLRLRLPALSWLAFALVSSLSAATSEAIDLGSRRELFVDEFLVASRSGVEFQLHPPVRREVVLVRDAPWEGSGSDFERLIRDKDIIRLYYMGTEATNRDGTLMGHHLAPANFAEAGKNGRPVYTVIPIFACYAESRYGIHWLKPNLGLFDYNGSKDNNIVWMAPELDNFTPFNDSNPDCPPEERYKATTRGPRDPGALFALKSADGIHWTYLSHQPIITAGAFDSQNNAFWDPLRKVYWCYFRGYHDRQGRLTPDHLHGIRDLRVTTSKDFRHWAEPQVLRFGDSPDVPLYTNQIEPYYRAPHLFVGFPTRYVDRKVFSPAAMAALPDPAHRKNRMKFSPRYGTVVTDGQFMSSRDGYAFRRWDETFIRPGPERRDNWLYGDGYQSLGLLETPAEDPTAPPELSCYLTEDEWKRPTRVRRYTMRVDGFVTLHARQEGGEFVTKPLVFAGRTLTLNFSTSAGGSLRDRIGGCGGQADPGLRPGGLRRTLWRHLGSICNLGGRSDLGALAGRPVRLRVTLTDADLYSLKFRAGPEEEPEGGPAVVPTARTDEYARRCHEDFLRMARQGGIDLLFFGDSIMEQWGIEANRGVADPGVILRGKPIWEKEFAPRHAANFSISGDRTQNLLWRFEHGELDGIHPRLIVLMIGANNTRDTPQAPQNTATEIIAGITAVVREIRLRLPETKILLQGIFPRALKEDPVRDEIRAVNSGIARLDDGDSVRYLDVGAGFLEPDGTLPTTLFPDHLHPSRQAFQIWADAIREPVAALMQPNSK